jgi:predicted phosphoribosyltransferase
MFQNREDAARQLAAKLAGRQFTRPLVLAIPRGGIVTGGVLAHEIEAELDVVWSRKLRAPDQPELAIGAISERGEVYENAEAEYVSDEYFHQERMHQLSVIAQLKERVRHVRPAAEIAGRSVIVTDDGIATGATMIAALETVRAQHPAELIVAIPVAPADRVHDLQLRCDEVVCLVAAQHLWSVGKFYESFPSVEDQQVVDILKESHSVAR